MCPEISRTAADRKKVLGCCLAVAATITIVACGGGGSGGNLQLPPAPVLQIKYVGNLVANNAVNVDPRVSFDLNFNTTINADGVTSDDVQLSDGTNSLPLAISVAGAFMTVTPTSPLKVHTHYDLTIKAGIPAENGTRMLADSSLSFTTARVAFQYQSLVPDFSGVSGYISGGTQVLIAVGDVNGDGRPDLVRLSALPVIQQNPTAQGYQLDIFAQNASGGFDNIQEIEYVISGVNYEMTFSKVVLLDIDGDGVPEILVPEYGLPEIYAGGAAQSGLRIFKQGSDGKYAAAGFISTISVRNLDVLDIDGDGRPDLIGSINSQYNNSVQVFWNTGTGLVLSPPVNIQLVSTPEFALIDLAHDGKREIIVNQPNFAYTAPSSQLSVLSLNSSGVLSLDPALTQLASGVCAGCWSYSGMTVIDINGDGWDDLLFTGVQPLITMGSNTPTVAFMRVPGGGFVEAFETNLLSALSPPVVDMDGDGVPDLAIVGINSSEGNEFVAVAFANDAGNFDYSSANLIPGTFAEAELAPGTLAVIDINGDGLPDFVIAGGAGAISVMQQLP